MWVVYLLCDSGHDNVYKIGITKQNIEKRIKQLQTGNGCEIFLTAYHETEYPHYIEKMLHKRFSSDKEIGEWFSLENIKPSDFKKECEMLERNIDALKDNPFFKEKKK